VLCPGQLYLVGGTAPWSSPLADIDSVSKRRYQLRSVALELFLVSGESHLIVFRNQTYRFEKRKQIIFILH
jgi:hypothetical protein